MLQTPQHSDCLANLESRSLVCIQQKYYLFLQHFLQPLSYISAISGANSTSLILSICLPKAEPSANQIYHWSQRTSSTSLWLQSHEQSTRWKAPRTGEFLILKPPGPMWEAAELSNDPVWKTKEKGETSCFFIGGNGDNEIGPSQALFPARRKQ